MAEQIWMPFGVVGQLGLSMCLLHEDADRLKYNNFSRELFLLAHSVLCRLICVVSCIR